MFKQIKTFIEELKDFRKAKRVESELLRETARIMEAAKTIDGLKEWIGREYWYIRPNGVVEKCKIARVNIDISDKDVQVVGIGERGEYYNELAFMDEDSARDLGRQVAGTYIKNLEAERDYLQRELELVYDAMLNANVPEKHDMSEIEKEPEIDMAYIDELIKNKVKYNDLPADKVEVIKKLIKQRKAELKKQSEKEALVKKTKEHSKKGKKNLDYDVTKGNNDR